MLARKAGADARSTNLLAREATGDEVNRREAVAVSNVSKPGNIGPVPGEDSGAELIELHLPHDLHTRPLQAKVEAADAAEQRAYAHSHALQLALPSRGGAGREARAFVSDCRASANWLKRSLDQRARTILAVATEIVRRQDGFFSEGIAGLQPLTLAMVAEATGMHESTASRVTSNKYIATERGIFELKFFFTNAVGRAGTAAAAVRHRIRAMIDAEVPGAILSDDMIVVRLREDGIEIARRTVAKYRRVLGLPSSAGRRRLKAMVTHG